MSDVKALEAQVDRLIAAGFSQVESNRLLSSSMQVMTAQVGRLCDEMGELARRVDTRQGDSERAIRLLDAKLANHVENTQKRLETLEKRQASG